MEKRPVFLSLSKTRVYLSPVQESDLAFFQRIMNDERISRFLLTRTIVGEVDEREWHENIAKRKQTDRTCAIVLKETDEIIGNIGLHMIDWVSRTAATGTVIGKEDLLGKSLGTEAKMLMLKYAFLELNLRMIISRAYAFNGRSIRYSEKCGYKQVAVYPDFIFRDGKYHDLIHLMVTREMWEPLWIEFEKKMKGETE